MLGRNITHFRNMHFMKRSLKIPKG